MEANEDKINAVTQFATKLVEEDHFEADKIKKKAASIHERRDTNRDKAQELMDQLRDQLQLHQFLQDSDELQQWIQAKK